MICVYLPGVNEDGWLGNSYQNRSPLFNKLNCKAMMQLNVGPTTPPCAVFSDTPPDHRSMSNGDLYGRTRYVKNRLRRHSHVFVDSRVYRFITLYGGVRHETRHFFEPTGHGQSTKTSELHITGQPEVSTSLYVERYQVKAEPFTRLFD